MHASEANFFPESVSTQISPGPKIFTKESEPFVDKSPRWILSGQWIAGEGHSKQNNGPSFFSFWQLRVVHRILAPQGFNLCPLPWKHGVLTTGPSGKS